MNDSKKEITNAEELFQYIEEQTTHVPCGLCNECCRNDAIFLKPEDGDWSRYTTEFMGGHVILAHKDNGDCVYLDSDKGCTIYEDRPFVCRKLDCRVFLKAPEYIQEGVSRRVLKAAKKLKKELILRKRSHERIRGVHL